MSGLALQARKVDGCKSGNMNGPVQGMLQGRSPPSSDRVPWCTSCCLLAYMLTQAGFVQVLATECEIEEEYLVNNLQKRIGKLHQEKTQLEQSLGVLQRKVISNARGDCADAAYTTPCLCVLQSCSV